MLYDYLVTISPSGHALNCFNCTSVLDAKCGKTWDFTGTEGDKYLVKCEGNTVACRKLETTDSYKGMALIELFLFIFTSRAVNLSEFFE